MALQKPGDDQAGCQKANKSNQAKNCYVVLACVEEWPLQKRDIHVVSLNGSRTFATVNDMRSPEILQTIDTIQCS